MENCIFCKIIKGDIPSTKVYEDEKMIIIRDIAPQAPVHLLMIPKEHYATVAELNQEKSAILGECFRRLGEIKDSLGLADGFRIIINQGDDACQTVKHLHVHILAGKKLSEKMI